MSARRIFDRSVTPEWMSLALGFARSEDDPSRGRELLNLSLKDEIESKTGRGKTVTVLTRAWLIPDPDAEPVIEWAREKAGGDMRPWHMGALFANYPFFADACAAVGRQLSLEERVSTIDLRTKLKARWGDRSVIDVAAWSVVRTLRSFGVLDSTVDDSISERGQRIPVDVDVFSWLIHALLVAHDDMEIDTSTAVNAPEFFMFDPPPRISNDYPNLEQFTEGGGRIVARRRTMDAIPNPVPKQLTIPTD